MKNYTIDDFHFIQEHTFTARDTDVVATISTSLASLDDVFAVFKAGLHLPEYARNNWNSLDELLRFPGDWVQGTRIVILHTGLPVCFNEETDPVEIQTYLDVLGSAVIWHHQEKQSATDFVVIFPDDMKARVQRISDIPPTWWVDYGFHETVFERMYDPSWSKIEQLLHLINGLTADHLQLWHELVGGLAATYSRKKMAIASPMILLRTKHKQMHVEREKHKVPLHISWLMCGKSQ